MPKKKRKEKNLLQVPDEAKNAPKQKGKVLSFLQKQNF